MFCTSLEIRFGNPSIFYAVYNILYIFPASWHLKIISCLNALYTIGIAVFPAF